MDPLHLVTGPQLAKDINIGERWLRELRKQGLIPFLKLGHRTLRYDPVAVARALEKLSTKERLTGKNICPPDLDDCAEKYVAVAHSEDERDG